MTRSHHNSRPRRTLALLAGCSIFGAAACSELSTLEQANPGQLQTATLYVPANAQLLVNGAIGDFQCAFLRYSVGSGVLMDCLLYTSPSPRDS